MKIIQFVLAFLLLAGTAWAADNAALLGTWHHEENMANVGRVAEQMTFARDGTFRGHVDVDGRRFWNFGGNWQMKDGWLHYDYTQSDRADIPAGTKDRDQIINITRGALTIKSENGEEIYQRTTEE